MKRNEDSGFLPSIRKTFIWKSFGRLSEKDRVLIQDLFSPTRIALVNLTERFKSSEERNTNPKSGSPLLGALIESCESIKKPALKVPFHVVGKRFSTKAFTMPKIVLSKVQNTEPASYENLKLESKLKPEISKSNDRSSVKRYLKQPSTKNMLQVALTKRSDSNLSISAWD